MTRPDTPLHAVTLREMYAAAALVAVTPAGGSIPGDEAVVARRAVALADALIAQLNAARAARPCIRPFREDAAHE